MEIPDYLRRPTPYTLRRRAERRAKKRARIGILVLAFGALVLAAALSVVSYKRPNYPDPCELEAVTCEGKKGNEQVEAYVTGFNTVPAQTDSTPCMAASGADICGHDDVAACPRKIPLGTVIEIEGKEYTCLDRLAPQYDNRYDISCDKDMLCPYAVTGYKLVTIKKL